MKARRMRLLLLALLATAIATTLFLQNHANTADPTRFRPPGAAARAAAVGGRNRLPPALKAAFDPADPGFSPVPMPGSSDWLAGQRESGQTFAQYQRGRPNQPDQKRSTLYLLPIGPFDDAEGVSIDQVMEYAEAFFMMPVKSLPPVSDQGLPVTERTNRGRRQLLSTDILSWLPARVPDDAYCLLGVTMIDLYPDPDWNYVFGQASLRDRVGVYSFARYDPRFWGKTRDAQSPSQMLRRSCRVLAHETGHMFGIKHCVHFHCMMNGSNHLDESDSQPLHLCPVCLRKLHWAKPFDVAARYEKLKSFADKAGWDDVTQWISTRLERINVPIAK